jgi:hypothetical protein
MGGPLIVDDPLHSQLWLLHKVRHLTAE